MRVILNLALMLAFILNGCGSGKDTTVSGTRRRRAREVPVTVRKAVTDDLVFSSEKIGAVKVNRQVSVNFTSPGQLEAFFASEDQYVHEGEPIARLSDTELRAKVETARLRLAELEKQKDKLEIFLAKGVVTEAEYDHVKTQYLTAREELSVAEDKLSRVVVKAPFSGILLKQLAQKGSFVPPGVPVAILVDIDKVRVELDISDSEAAKIQTGQSLDVTADAFPGRIFKARVARRLPSVDPRSRMTRIELKIDNPGRVLRPGMLVRTKIVVSSYRQVISLPVDCLVYQGNSVFVYLVEPGSSRVARRDVTLGKMYRDRVVVTRGLRQGDVVVETGQSFLSDGTLVRILQ